MSDAAFLMQVAKGNISRWDGVVASKDGREAS